MDGPFCTFCVGPRPKVVVLAEWEKINNGSGRAVDGFNDRIDAEWRVEIHCTSCHRPGYNVLPRSWDRSGYAAPTVCTCGKRTPQPPALFA